MKPTMFSSLLRASLLTLLLPGAALADQEFPLPVDSAKVSVLTNGEYRLQIGVGSPIPVDAEGTELSQSGVLDQRLRVGVGLRADFITLATEWDLFSGQLGGSAWGIPGTVDARNRHLVAAEDGLSALKFIPRKGSVTFAFPVATIEVGLVTSDWGLGLLANSGNRDPYFGRNDFGDRTLRGRATFRPLMMNPKTKEGAKAAALNISAAFDYVIDDDFGRLADRQTAVQGVISALWYEPDHCRHGIYLVYRHQKELEFETTTDALVVDVLLDQHFTIGGGTARLAMEAALISGRTNRSPTWNSRDDVAVFSGAVTGLASVAMEGDRVGMDLRAGFASGDRDPDDGVSQDFSFDRDFDVGQVLFDELMGGVEAAAHALIIDPENTGHPPDAIDGIVTEGAARRTVFVQPMVHGKPVPMVNLRAGLLMAWSSGPIRHPFYGTRAGGAETNHHNEPAEGRYLGTEFDWSAGLEIPFTGSIMDPDPDAPRVEVLLQGGHAALGKSMRRADGSDPAVAHRLLMAARLRW
ncbi:MAG: hypothetical protein KDA24_16365 [Deltaproteobacteria bacterium]|nr:hypothetical protein [Deltaproteobacteria bacterium]